MQHCPSCRLLNPPEATRCDCGFDFLAGTRVEPPARSDGPGTRLVTFGRRAVLGGFLGGGVLGAAGRSMGGPAALALGAVGDLLSLVGFFGVALWIIGAHRRRSQVSAG